MENDPPPPSGLRAHMFSCQTGQAVAGVWPVNTEKAARSNVALPLDILPLRPQKSPEIHV